MCLIVFTEHKFFQNKLSVITEFSRPNFQDLPRPNRAWLLDNHSLTPVASGMPLVYQVTQIIPYKESRGCGMLFADT